MRLIDLTGQKFGRLLVIEKVRDDKSGSVQWKCKCECGNIVTVAGGHLRSGHTKSCGCYREVINNLTGKKFGRLTVLEVAERTGRKTYWLCKCDCGNLTKVQTASLNNGHTKSCGCLQKTVVTTHGKKKTKLYSVWNSMKERCFNTNHPAYKNYGGRGITVCDEWCEDFQAFYDWSMENGYKAGLSIDREDNDGNYEPGNCRWTTSKVQRNNSRQNRYVEFEGECHTIAEWAEIKGINRWTLWERIVRRKWPIEKALNTPAGKYRRKDER